MSCIDAPCCGCCDPAGDLMSPELVAEMEEAELWDEPFDGFLTDAEADADVLASAEMGCNEDYDPCYDMLCEGYDEH